jgi:mediator of RNA polymerase II transcription subunit 11
MSSLNSDRLLQLEQIERDLVSALQSAGHGIQELGKDKPSMKQVEQHSNQFLKTLENVENSISKQLVYLTQVSTGQTHEGSCYGHQKQLNMAQHRLEHVRNRLQSIRKPY